LDESEPAGTVRIFSSSRPTTVLSSAGSMAER
jgi:hypothetical protein